MMDIPLESDRQVHGAPALHFQKDLGVSWAIGVPPKWTVCKGKIPLKWMMTCGISMTQETHGNPWKPMETPISSKFPDFLDIDWRYCISTSK